MLPCEYCSKEKYQTVRCACLRIEDALNELKLSTPVLSFMAHNRGECEDFIPKIERRTTMMHEMSILQRAIAKWGDDAQMKMVLEEMSELQKEICKRWRGKNNTDAIAEEVADVEIMLDQLKIMLGICEDVKDRRTEKLFRLQERLEGKA